MKIDSMKMIKNITAKNLVALTVTCLLLAACKDNFTNPTSPTGSTITTVASTTDSLKVFYAALNKIGDASTFSNVNSGQFTVFAPSNYAFIKYLRSLSVPNSTNFTTDSAVKYVTNKVTATSTPLSISTLTARLNYHVISTAVTTSEITGAQGFTTMQGARLSLSNVSGATNPFEVNANVTSSGGGSGSNIIVNDLTAANGVIQVVDRVMSPITTANIWASSLLNFSVNYTVSPITNSIGSTLIPIDATASTPDITYYDVTNAPVDSDTTNYNLFTMALVRGGLATSIIPNGLAILPDYTVFAPTDGSFIRYLSTLSGTVTNESTARTYLATMDAPTLASLVNYHIVNGRVLSTDLSNGESVSTWLTGKTFTVNVNGSVITLSDINTSDQDAKISAPNKLSNAGIVHSIQRVLLAQ